MRENKLKRILLTFACLLAFAASAFATETGERVLTLPCDEGAWYLTIFGEAEDEKFTELQTWLKTNEGLAKLKAQVRFNEYTTDQFRYQRYVEDMPGLPCIRLQNEKGLVVSEFWGDSITSASNLYRGIKRDLQSPQGKARQRRRGCPMPKPKPPVEPIAPVAPVIPTGPPVLEPEESEESRLWILLMVLGGLAGGALGFAQGYKKEHMDKPGPKQRSL